MFLRWVPSRLTRQHSIGKPSYCRRMLRNSVTCVVLDVWYVWVGACEPQWEVLLHSARWRGSLKVSHGSNENYYFFLLSVVVSSRLVSSRLVSSSSSLSLVFAWKGRKSKEKQGKARKSNEKQGKARKSKEQQGKTRKSNEKQGKARKSKEYQGIQGKARKSNEKQGKARKSKEKQRKARNNKEKQGKARKIKEKQRKTASLAFHWIAVKNQIIADQWWPFPHQIPTPISLWLAYVVVTVRLFWHF